jgi:hypothetical protein
VLNGGLDEWFVWTRVVFPRVAEKTPRQPGDNSCNAQYAEDFIHEESSSVSATSESELISRISDWESVHSQCWRDVVCETQGTCKKSSRQTVEIVKIAMAYSFVHCNRRK